MCSSKLGIQFSSVRCSWKVTSFTHSAFGGEDVADPQLVEQVWELVAIENTTQASVEKLGLLIDEQERKILEENGYTQPEDHSSQHNGSPGDHFQNPGANNQGTMHLQIPADISFDSDQEGEGMKKDPDIRSSIEGEDALIETIERIAKIQQKLTDLAAVLKKESNHNYATVENIGEKVARVMQRTAGLSAVLTKNKQDLAAENLEKERLLRKIQQNEVDFRLQLEICQSLQSQNKEFITKMSQCEELVVQIEHDKSELFDKVQSLEEENETLIKEKLELKVELSHSQTVKADAELQIKKLRDQIKVLESISNYQEEELQGEKLNAKQVEELKQRLVESQKQLEELRVEQDEEKQKYLRLEKVCAQLRSDLQREADFGNSMKKEITELRTKYLEGIEGRKQELGLSALAASKLYTAYKIRETVGGSIE